MMTVSEAPRRVRGQGQKTEARKQDIVDAAFGLFSQQGFNAASLRGVAERVGVSHTALIHHFGSKDGLLLAVLARRQEREQPIREAAAAEQGILDAAITVARYNMTHPGIIRLHTVMSAEATDPDHPAHEFFKQHYDSYVTWITPLLEQEASGGNLRPDVHVEALAHQFAALIDGLQIQWLYDNSFDYAANLQTFVHSLRPPV